MSRVFLSSLALCAALVACGGGSDPVVTPPPPPPVTPVAVISPATATMILGRSERFTASAHDNTGAVVPADRITWSSSDETVAQVSATGLVTMVGPGAPARITASGGGASASAIVTPSGLAYRQIVVGSTHVCGITTAGATYCWGQNTEGQLGNVVTDFQTNVPTAMSGGPSFTSLAAGGSFMCGLTAVGDAYCWGNNNSGQLGSTSRGATPAAVGGSLHFTALAAGANHTCGLDAAGVVYCWGRNDHGQLGDGKTVTRLAPAAISSAEPFASISAATADHTCGITRAGAMYCWGAGASGQLGDGASVDRAVPTLVPGTAEWGTVSVFVSRTCALTTDGRAFCWGAGTDGRIGDGNSVDRAVPTAVATNLRFRSISAGAFDSCALTATGATYCWGWQGRLVPVPELFPTPVPLTDIHGGLVSCGRSAMGVAFCWGDGHAGMLGDGTYDERLTPLSVTVP